MTSIYHICCHLHFSRNITMVSKHNSHLQYGFMASFQGYLLLFGSSTKTSCPNNKNSAMLSHY